MSVSIVGTPYDPMWRVIAENEEVSISDVFAVYSVFRFHAEAGEYPESDSIGAAFGIDDEKVTEIIKSLVERGRVSFPPEDGGC